MEFFCLFVRPLLQESWRRKDARSSFCSSTRSKSTSALKPFLTVLKLRLHASASATASYSGKSCSANPASTPSYVKQGYKILSCKPPTPMPGVTRFCTVFRLPWMPRTSGRRTTPTVHSFPDAPSARCTRTRKEEVKRCRVSGIEVG